MSPPGRARVLVADDEPSIRFVLDEALSSAGCDVTCVDSGDGALEALARESFDVAFLDIRMPGPSGLELLDHVRALGSGTSVVIVTAQNTFENAVESMKRGALDYLVKPFKVAEVTALVEKALRARALEREVKALRREVARQSLPGDRLVGRSPRLLDIFKTIGKVAGRDVSVLVTGESGTGKELVARAIHGASARAANPFVPVNAAAIPRELLESELFGHERGAFTGAVESRAGRFREASAGTIFLDEIGDMPPELQAKLLRVLQSGEVTPVGGKRTERVDVRVIAATHRDLETEVHAGRFREDLLYRLRVVPIEIPPLRERREDIPALAEHFVARYAEELSTGPRYLAEPTLRWLEQHDWPGNVRELENAIKRALALSAGEVLTPEDFGFLAPSASPEPPGGDLPDHVRREVEAALARAESGEIYRELLERVERPLLSAVLEHTGGNQIRAAAILGINRNTLRKKIADLGISLPPRCEHLSVERLHGLHVLADDDPRWKHDPVEQARAACRGGARVVQLRAKHASDGETLRWAAEIRRLTRQAQVLFVLNDRFDLALAAEADGVHLGQEDLPPARLPRDARERLLVGRSTHSEAELLAAREEPVDYVAFGPVFGTHSKASPHPPQGLGALRRAAALAGPRPLVAIGGIHAGNAAEALRAGAHALAVISAVAGAPDPLAATRALVAALAQDPPA